MKYIYNLKCKKNYLLLSEDDIYYVSGNTI